MNILNAINTLFSNLRLSTVYRRRWIWSLTVYFEIKWKGTGTTPIRPSSTRQLKSLCTWHLTVTQALRAD